MEILANILFSLIFLFLALIIVSMYVYLVLDSFGTPDIQKKLNELYKCTECGLVHRMYQRALLLKEDECPHCHEHVWSYNFEKIYSGEEGAEINYPFAPKLSLLKAIKIKRAIKKNKENEILDKQIEKYLKLQENQLMKMKDKKDELIKLGVFDK